MQSIVLARATHVLAYVEVLRRIGAPVERELRRAKLPTLLQEVAERYVPAIPALNFLDSIARSEGVPDLGVLATERGTFRRLREDTQASIRSAPTLYARLRRFGELVVAENTSLRFAMISEGDRTRLCLSMSGVPRSNVQQYSEWLQIDGMIDTIRDAIGSRWQPLEITFQSRFEIPNRALERFPDVHLRVGCAETSIAVPSRLLGEFLARNGGQSPQEMASAQTKITPVFASPGFAESLKLALRAYLHEGYPDIDAAAEIAGMSTRTLQRRLVQSGLSYRSLVREARVEAAAEILASPKTTVLEAAYAVGYTDPSNFSRAFRQVTGASPRRHGAEHLEIAAAGQRRSR